MNLGRSEAIALATKVAAGVRRDDVDVAVYPPAIWVTDAADHVVGSNIIVGAQNCSPHERGAYTGEISAWQIAEVASSVLIGHSERRHKLGETDNVVRSKIDAALAAGITPVFCVGETPNVRNRTGEYVPYVMEQVRSSMSERSYDEITRMVVAYEPVWAIGTGVAATPADAQEMTAAIRLAIDGIAPGAGERVRILYGGSVTPANAAELLAQPDVDGALVGGASLNAADFLAIVEAAPRRI
ncbi:MAG: triose-phosphate isomerase [Thermomicrobiales bacterium]|nr:triose-phosphate isomerase [Thermomicrobiales bacterium]